MLSFEEQHHISVILFVCVVVFAANDIPLMNETIQQEKFRTQALGWETNLSLVLE